MRIRVELTDGHVEGEFEAPVAPAVGDQFFVREAGPYRVVARKFYFERPDPAVDVRLIVEPPTDASAMLGWGAPA